MLSSKIEIQTKHGVTQKPRSAETLLVVRRTPSNASLKQLLANQIEQIGDALAAAGVALIPFYGS